MYDSIIIGTGPAGLSAALNLQIHKKNFIWFGSKSLSDKVRRAEKINNYPGMPGISGEELFERYQEHIGAAGLEIAEKTVTSVLHAGDYYMILADNEMYETRTLILCTGVMSAKMLEGEKEFLGRGVSYCATRDGEIYRNKKIAVLCNTQKCEHEAEYLADLASEVIYFPAFVGSRIEKENVKISRDFPVSVYGSKRVEGIKLSSGACEEVMGVFCLRNAIAPTALVPGLLAENGHVSVNRRMETNLPGCYAAGDCTGRPYQYAKAAGEGNVAAHSCIGFLAGLS